MANRVSDGLCESERQTAAGSAALPTVEHDGRRACPTECDKTETVRPKRGQPRRRLTLRRLPAYSHSPCLFTDYLHHLASKSFVNLDLAIVLAPRAQETVGAAFGPYFKGFSSAQAGGEGSWAIESLEILPYSGCENPSPPAPGPSPARGEGSERKPKCRDR